MNEPTVLIVDDEPLLTDIVADALEDSGFTVVIANDGAAAIAIIEGGDPAIAALVTDVNMGAGADGWSVARHARSLHPDLPVVYTTGGAMHEWAANGVPASVLVPKPSPPREIVEAINDLMTVR